MIKIEKFDNFKDDFDERVSGKLFYKFVIVLFAFYIFLIICSQIFYANYSYVTISGTSMQNTLNPNPVASKQDGVYIKYTQDVDYGDIIILNSRITNYKTTIIKRALAFEGDFITIAKVPVEGVAGGEYRFMRKKLNSPVEVLYEDYIKGYQFWSANKSIYVPSEKISYEETFYGNYKKLGYKEKTFPVDELDGKEVTFFEVPENHVFFMGDNRSDSTDARSWAGTHETSKIVGKVIDIIHDGTNYPGNHVWWINRMVGFIKICWNDILRFFGANI